MPKRVSIIALLLAQLMGGNTMALEDDVPKPPFARGRAIYLDVCAACHGEAGQGVEGANDGPLVGDLAFQQLVEYVDQTMPEGNATQCVGEDAEAVTWYFMDAFYTREARLRNEPPKIQFSRLTVNQFHNAVSDTMQSLIGKGWLSEKRGLTATYFSTHNFQKESRRFERVDHQINSDFKTGTPEGDGFDDDQQFSINWEGALIAPETGAYEIFVKSENGFRLYLNTQARKQAALIDNWVNAGEVNYTASIKLRAGRVYPLTLQFVKYKERSASILMQWKPPQGIRQVIPQANLSPEKFPLRLQLKTDFPPDDRSVGYERGTSVSTAWDRATTQAAVEVIQFAEANWNLIGDLDLEKQEADSLSDEDRAKQTLQRFRAVGEKFAQTAFRRPVTPRERKFFIDRNFATAKNPEAALTRVMLLVLKSPQFLYVPNYDAVPTSFDVATRLSLTLHDSIPDGELMTAAKDSQLNTKQQVYEHAWRLLGDRRARTKVREFFHEWLELERAGMGTKDADAFPGFDQDLIASLRHSLDLSIESIVWSEESDFRHLFTQQQLFVDQQMADFYQVDVPDSGHFEPVSFEADHRAGVLTHPFLMAGLAYHRNTSPIHRGVFVAKRLLGRTLKSPPEEVEPLEEDFAPTMTTRQRVAHQTKSTLCQSCHCIINPLGFSFENFDAVGRYRETEKQQPINTTSEYLTPTGDSHQLTSANDLAKFLVTSEDVHRNFVEQLFQHMTKQPLAAYGPAATDQLVAEFQGSQFNIRNLLVEIAVLVAQHRR